MQINFVLGTQWLCLYLIQKDVTYFFLYSEGNCCVDEVLTVWLSKVETDHEIVKLGLPLLQKIIKKCMQWCSQQKSDLLMKMFNISLVSTGFLIL